ncbi:hypothetical protein [Chryseobacterium echinoideorum]|uniref:hypothetical protein n=1 Tax=Chryseobacterium echinoideorum TaxID=1549648 RepID=UPI00118646D6|nr:hypothetical protein [Chryseobacterium echinoideorum]
MLKTIDEKFSGFLFVVIFPFLLFFMSYYGFESTYVGLKIMKEAPDFMFSSVYAYRVIPNFVMVEVFEGVNYLIKNYFVSQESFILKNGTVFYHSIFLINAFFFVLSSIILNKILNYHPSDLFKGKVNRIFHLLAIFFIVIVQYVPTNCDLIAVFFYLLGILFTLRYYRHQRTADLILLCTTILVSTFVRETSCLNIAFFAAMFLDLKNLRQTRILKETVFLIISFVLPYFALKMMIPQEASFFEGIYIKNNFTSPFNLAGLMFGILGYYFMLQLGNSEHKIIMKKYLFFSMPYLLMITFVGLFWESRLFLPLILTALIIASHQLKIFVQPK